MSTIIAPSTTEATIYASVRDSIPTAGSSRTELWVGYMSSREIPEHVTVTVFRPDAGTLEGMAELHALTPAAARDLARALLRAVGYEA